MQTFKELNLAEIALREYLRKVSYQSFFAFFVKTRNAHRQKMQK
jgi:hypothetical protein